MRKFWHTRSVMPGFILCVVALMFLAGICQASPDRTYTVRKGDNLNKISRKFRVPVEAIRNLNDLDSITLRTGAKLKIPVKGQERKKHGSESPGDGDLKTSAKNGKPSILRISDKETTASDSDVRYHTVRKGDTLASVAREHDMSVKELAELNNIKKKSASLKRGRKLIVAPSGPKTYTVKKSDTIWKIANRFDISADDLMEINELESPDVKAGQKLVLEVWNKDMETADPAKTEAAAEISKEINSLEASQELEALTVKERLILFAKKMLNIPYRFGGSTFVGIDCSGYVQKVFGFMDVTLPRTAREQFHLGEPVSKEDLSIGDLVFFKTYASFPSHVGIYLGNNLFIHASSKNRKVSIDSLETPYYFKRFIGAKRLFNDELSENLDQIDKG